MNFRTFRALLVFFWVQETAVIGQVSIFWSSDANAVNRDSNDLAMDAGFRFELGVFTGTFVPTPANKNQWAANWNAAQRTGYNSTDANFSAAFDPPENDGEFTAGKAAYIWGFRGTPVSAEWILFRANSWSWPFVDPLFPSPPLQWFAEDATAILGEIMPSGSPFLMKSAAVANASPPATTWDQWKLDSLSGEPLNAAADDPDRDGMSNLLEFVFGTAPKTANAPVATPVVLQSGHAVITIPRRIDHLVNCTVEVSGNLVNWQSGPLHTEVIQNDAAALVVRDLTPVDAANPQRFIRLKATLP
jgi:hypothetical protein